MRKRFQFEALESRRLLSGGDVDTSFGVNGRATLDFTIPSDDMPSSVVVLPDGRFLVGHNSFATSSNDVGAFSRHLANGQLDTTFGNGTGRVRLGDGWGTLGIEDMFVRAGGEIIAMGRGATGTPAVRAFSADGVPLPSSSFNFPTSGVSTNRVQLLPLATGGGGYLLTTVAVHKFNANGSLDGSFGSGGTFTFPTVNNAGFRGTGLAADSTGALYVSGYNVNNLTGVRQPAVAKVTTGGAFASGWGTAGVLTFSTLGTDGDQLSSIVVDGADRPIVAGTDASSTTPDRAIVARLTTGGTLDATFNGVGTRFFTPPAGSDSSSGDLKIDPSGRIVLAGAYVATSTGAPTYFLSRLTTTGGLDNAFAGDGVQEALLPASAGVQVWYGPPALDSAGNIVMGIGTRVSIQNLDGDSTLFRVSGATGQRDTAFGTPGGNGTQVVAFAGSAANRTTAAVRQGDGKLLYVGTATGGGVSGWLVGRLNADGSPDNTFGTAGGTLRIDWNGAISQIPSDIKLDAAGRIVIAGWVADTTSDFPDVAFARLLSNGQPDSSFGAAAGRSRLTVPVTSEVPSTMAFQSDGKIVFGGHVQPAAGATRVASVGRLNVNGSLDTTFGQNGRRILNPAAGDSNVHDVFVLGDGSILAAAAEEQSSPYQHRRLAAKLTPGGALDGTYGAGGVAYANTFAEDVWYGNANAAVDAAGRLYVPGTGETFVSGYVETALVTRFTPAGGVDTTFGTDGTARVLLKSSSDNFSALAIDPWGRPIVGASVTPSGSTTGSDMLFVRLDGAGQRDTTFGSGGERRVDVAGSTDVPVSLEFTPDEKLVALGYSSSAATSTDFSAVRLTNLPGLPAWVAPGGAATWDAGTRTLTVTGAATIVADPGADSPTITASGPAAVVTIAPPAGAQVTLGGLQLSNNASARVAPEGAARTLVLASGVNFNLDATATLDLTDNAMVIRNADLAAASAQHASVNNRVRAAFHEFAWDGFGITSTTAKNDVANGVPSTLGILLNNDGGGGPLFYGPGTDNPTFMGAAVDSNTVMIRFTRLGDGDLNGAVDTVDFALFQAGYTDAAPYVGFAFGDYDYNGVVDTVDFGLFQAGYSN